MIRAAEISDVDRIVDLHLKSLRDGILFRLGRTILVLFYKEAIINSDCFVLLSLDNEEIVGVSASSLDASFFFEKFKKKYFLKLFFAFIKSSLVNPVLVYKFILQGKYPEQPKEELMMLFVDSHVRSKGLGRHLVDATVEEYKRRNTKSFKITILTKNIKGRKFYEKFGFIYDGLFTYLQESRAAYTYNISK